MKPQTLYDANLAKPAYLLRYSWAGWPSDGELPTLEPAQLLASIGPSWETDGLRLLEHNCLPERIQLTFSAKPHVSPVVIAACAKGRLQYALRQTGKPCRFSRKVSLRSIGNNTREAVEQYIRGQVSRESFADARFAEQLQALHVSNDIADLSQPSASARGRYWFNIHLVLVSAERYRTGDMNVYERMRDGCLRIAAKHEYAIAELSLMPDHLHVALRGNIEHSPAEIAMSFKNNLAHLLGRVRWWSDGYYVGTFGEYDMRAVRRRP